MSNPTVKDEMLPPVNVRFVANVKPKALLSGMGCFTAKLRLVSNVCALRRVAYGAERWLSCPQT